MEKKELRKKIEELDIKRIEELDIKRKVSEMKGDVVNYDTDNQYHYISEEDILELLDKAREEVLTELQEEFSEFGVPDDVRYTKPLFYINEIIEEKLSKLKQ